MNVTEADREAGLKIAAEFQSFLDALKENPGKTLTFELAGKIAESIAAARQEGMNKATELARVMFEELKSEAGL